MLYVSGCLSYGSTPTQSTYVVTYDFSLKILNLLAQYIRNHEQVQGVESSCLQQARARCSLIIVYVGYFSLRIPNLLVQYTRNHEQGNHLVSSRQE